LLKEKTDENNPDKNSNRFLDEVNIGNNPNLGRTIKKRSKI
jgi:hypothetical protein